MNTNDLYDLIKKQKKYPGESYIQFNKDFIINFKKQKIKNGEITAKVKITQYKDDFKYCHQCSCFHYKGAHIGVKKC